MDNVNQPNIVIALSQCLRGAVSHSSGGMAIYILMPFVYLKNFTSRIAFSEFAYCNGLTDITWATPHISYASSNQSQHQQYTSNHYHNYSISWSNLKNEKNNKILHDGKNIYFSKSVEITDIDTKLSMGIEAEETVREIDDKEQVEGVFENNTDHTSSTAHNSKAHEETRFVEPALIQRSLECRRVLLSNQNTSNHYRNHDSSWSNPQSEKNNKIFPDGKNVYINKSVAATNIDTNLGAHIGAENTVRGIDDSEQVEGVIENNTDHTSSTAHVSMAHEAPRFVEPSLIQRSMAYRPFFSSNQSTSNHYNNHNISWSNSQNEKNSKIFHDRKNINFSKSVEITDIDANLGVGIGCEDTVREVNDGEQVEGTIENNTDQPSSAAHISKANEKTRFVEPSLIQRCMIYRPFFEFVRNLAPLIIKQIKYRKCNKQFAKNATDLFSINWPRNGGSLLNKAVGQPLINDKRYDYIHDNKVNHSCRAPSINPEVSYESSIIQDNKCVYVSGNNTNSCNQEVEGRDVVLSKDNNLNKTLLNKSNLNTKKWPIQFTNNKSVESIKETYKLPSAKGIKFPANDLNRKVSTNNQKYNININHIDPISVANNIKSHRKFEELPQKNIRLYPVVSKNQQIGFLEGIYNQIEKVVEEKIEGTRSSNDARTTTVNAINTEHKENLKPESLVNDEVLRVIVNKIKKTQQEERFRLGLLS